MHWTPQKNIRLGFWLAALVPVILGILGAISIRSLYVKADDLAHANLALQQLDKIYVELSDLESAETEYVIAAEARSLDRFERAAKQISGDIDELENRTAPNQKFWVDQLGSLFEQKKREFRQIVDRRQNEGIDVATRLRMEFGEGGTRTMDDIRTAIRNIRDTETKQLDLRTTEQAQSRMFAMIMFAAILGLNIALIASLRLLIRREAMEARREEERIRELNAQLESRVEQRTEALQRSNEDLQQFAFIVSHDLREPLRAVSSYSELLRRRYQGQLDSDADDYIQFIVDGVKRMSALISDLLSYSRAGEADDESLERFDTKELFDEVLQNLTKRIEDENASVTSADLPVIVAHRVWMSQVLQNLIANALKYRSEQSPVVHVSARQEKKHFVFSVRDNGLGIDSKYTNQVFKIFKRLHGREVEGTGIGLATCKKIVERAGGRIWVESKVGEGSTFFFTLPIIDLPAQTGTTVQPAHAEK